MSLEDTWRFDSGHAEEVTAGLEALQHRLALVSEDLAHDLRRLPWQGRARLVWDAQLSHRLDVATEVAHDLRRAIERIDDDHDRWLAHRSWGSRQAQP